MKHFNTQTGGRHTYAEDVMNLQELALAINAIFNGCDNFIVSGCEVENKSISPGIVYINGELRHFNGGSGINTWPVYLCESNSTENVTYESGQQKIGRTLYGVNMQSSIPSSFDPVTSQVPQYIKVEQTGGVTLRDAFFGKYALLKNAAASLQEVNTKLKFNKEVNILKELSLDGGLTVNGLGKAKVYIEGDSAVIEYRSANNKICKLILSEAGGYELVRDGNTVLKVNDKVESFLDFKAPKIIVGEFVIEGNEIYNTSNTDEGTIKINVTSPNNYYRNIVIGSGKGTDLFSIIGKKSLVKVGGEFAIEGGDSSLVLKSNSIKTSGNIVKKIIWKDSIGEEMAIIGFDNSQSLIIHNKLAGVVINSVGGLNVAHSIKEDGKLLSEKYVLAANLPNVLSGYEPKGTAYSKLDSDTKYSTKVGGFSQFITNGTTASMLRSQIGAVSLSDVKAQCPTLDKYLSDMATTASAKQKIRENIGAAPAGSYQSKMNDTGWVAVTNELWARQFGDMVFIQGVATTQKYDKTVFTLPNSIGSPAAAVVFNSVDHLFTAYINGGSRECKAWKCGNSNERIYFSMTYMTN